MQLESESRSSLETYDNASFTSLAKKKATGPIIPSTTISNDAKSDADAGISTETGIFSSFSPQSKGEETHPDHTRPFKNTSCDIQPVATGRKASIKKVIQSRTQESAETNEDNPEETVLALPQEMSLSIGWYFSYILCEEH